MKSRVFASFFAIAQLGCASSNSSLFGPLGFLTGMWSTMAVPSGGATVLTLHSADGLVSGTDQEYGLMGVLANGGGISGTYAAGAFTLRIEYPNDASATYSGRAVGRDTLDGLWTSEANPTGVNLKFFRQRQ